MIILGMRHAIAEPAEPGLRDADRALTPEGHRKLVGIARGIRALRMHPGKIWTSPWVRAAQTAAVVARELSMGEPTPTEVLTPGHSPPEVWERLLSNCPEEEILCVGHEPLLSDLAAYLLSGDTSITLRLKKGGLFAVDVGQHHGPGSGDLLFLLEPGHLRRAGKGR
ncbi:MAG: histidine phosphatase family protein [Planctomycetes bacterium]|nr:histidine phosphatase family protein [Planctomycetota bacterium]